MVGAGISGLGAAWALHQDNEIVVYEADQRLGGHSNTVEVETAHGAVPVDTGFIVYNEVTYPHLTRLFSALGVKSQESDMSFAFSMGKSFEYAASAKGLIAQPANLLRPRYRSMISDIIRFRSSGARAEAEKRRDHRRVVNPAQLQCRVSRGVSAPNDGQHLVGSSGGDTEIPGDLNPQIPRQPRSDPDHQQTHLANRFRWKPGVRSAPRPARSWIGSVLAAPSPWSNDMRIASRSPPTAGPRPSTNWCWQLTPIRDWRSSGGTQRTLSERPWEPFDMSQMWRCSTVTPP